VVVEPDYVLDEPGEVAAVPSHHRLHDTVTREKPDMSWHDFVRAVHEIRGDAAMKAVVVAVVMSTAGERGVPVDFDAVAAAVGRKRSTLRNMLPRLRAAGWLAAHATIRSDRAVKEYVTAKWVADA
jgi:hypothetical protein